MMKFALGWLVVCLGLLCMAPTALAKNPLLGKFELNDERIYIGLEVQMSDGHPVVIFAAARQDGGGAAPEGGGEGDFNDDGVLEFEFTDSFENSGSGTFRRSGDGFVLNIKLNNVQDPRCLIYYGKQRLERAEEE